MENLIEINNVFLKQCMKTTVRVNCLHIYICNLIETKILQSNIITNELFVIYIKLNIYIFKVLNSSPIIHTYES